MASTVWCNLCNRNVIARKKFNWIAFLVLCLTGIGGIFYIIYWIFKGKRCPICDGNNFGPARASEMGK